MNILFYTFLAVSLLFLTTSNRLDKKGYYVLKTIGYIVLALSIIYSYFFKQIDELSLVFGLSATYISLLTSLYSREYVIKKGFPKYTVLLIDLFTYTMIVSYASPNIIGLAIAWSIAEIIGYELVSIGVKHSLEGYTKASTLFLFLSTFTFELSIFTIIYTYLYSYTTSLTTTFLDILNRVLFTSFRELSLDKLIAPDYLIILSTIGFIVKSAQIPLHFWLVSAHTSAPSPASALLSGITTSMGVYGLLRLNTIFEIPVTILYTLLTISIVSIIYSGLQAIIQRDGKQLLAYSTILGNGFSIILFIYYSYLKSIEIYPILLVTVLSHMGYKSTLFLDIGLVEEIFGFRFIHRIRGLNNIIPYSTIGSVIAILSLIGIPPTTGFTSKLFTIVFTIRDIREPIVFTILLTTITYMVLTIKIGFNYIKIHFGSLGNNYRFLFEMKSIEDLQQKIVFLNSLSNIFFTLVLLLEMNIYGLFIITILALSPLLILLLYLLTIVMRRE
ncbi:MAG: proton-conducting transporter membrane subunit [Desulfurococcaceae archaeon]